MNEKQHDWNDLALFLAIAREGGLSAASRVTGRSPATLGRRMLALERALGRDLFVRHERGYALTRDARQMVEELAPVEARITRLTHRATETTRPLVKVSAGTWTTLALLDRIDELTGTPADIRLRFLSGEAVRDIPRREVVIGFRNRRPTDTALAGRRLSRVEFAPFGTKNAPDHWIKVLADTPSARWLERTVADDALCEVNAPRNSLDLAIAGKGIALLPTFIGEAHSQLIRRGDTLPDLAHNQWLVTHQDDRHLPEVRRAIDRMCQVLVKPLR